MKRAQLDVVDALKPVAKDLECSLAQLAIAWCAKDPNVSTVITGATKLSQVGGRGQGLKGWAGQEGQWAGRGGRGEGGRTGR